MLKILFAFIVICLNTDGLTRLGKALVESFSKQCGIIDDNQCITLSYNDKDTLSILRIKLIPESRGKQIQLKGKTIRVGLIDVENHECMTLGAFQTPNVKALEEMDYNLVDWYRELLISMKDRLQAISKYLVADAFFSKKTFILPLLGKPFSVSSCKSMIHNAYMLERFICVSGLRPNPQVIDKLFKELVLFTSRAA